MALETVEIQDVIDLQFEEVQGENPEMAEMAGMLGIVETFGTTGTAETFGTTGMAEVHEMLGT